MTQGISLTKEMAPVMWYSTGTSRICSQGIGMFSRSLRTAWGMYLRALQHQGERGYKRQGVLLPVPQRSHMVITVQHSTGKLALQSKLSNVAHRPSLTKNPVPPPPIVPLLLLNFTVHNIGFLSLYINRCPSKNSFWTIYSLYLPMNNKILLIFYRSHLSHVSCL